MSCDTVIKIKGNINLINKGLFLVNNHRTQDLHSYYHKCDCNYCNTEIPKCRYCNCIKQYTIEKDGETLCRFVEEPIQKYSIIISTFRKREFTYICDFCFQIREKKYLNNKE
jgi:hypothetical protein